MLNSLVTFVVVLIGMLATCVVGWRIGRIMSPRPKELREAARQFAEKRAGNDG